MIRLTPHECRILGVLIEKAQTTPGQYPMTLNALVGGANQKNNRDPVMNLTEERVIEALDGLRSKGLAREVMMSGSRVEKFRHIAREALEISTSELVVLAELLMRGPQTVGELRGRAVRMHKLESLEVVQNLLDHLIARPEPLVRRLPPSPGTRAERFAQLLCPEAHPLESAGQPRAAPIQADTNDAGSPDLIRRVEQLEAEVRDIREELGKLIAADGERRDLDHAVD